MCVGISKKVKVWEEERVTDVGDRKVRVKVDWTQGGE